MVEVEVDMEEVEATKRFGELSFHPSCTPTSALRPISSPHSFLPLIHFITTVAYIPDAASSCLSFAIVRSNISTASVHRSVRMFMVLGSVVIYMLPFDVLTIYRMSL